MLQIWDTRKYNFVCSLCNMRSVWMHLYVHSTNISSILNPKLTVHYEYFGSFSYIMFHYNVKLDSFWWWVVRAIEVVYLFEEFTFSRLSELLLCVIIVFVFTFQADTLSLSAPYIERKNQWFPWLFTSHVTQKRTLRLFSKAPVAVN